MDEHKKIYVITCGEYSDYQVCAATTDPERAEDMRRKISNVYLADNIRADDPEHALKIASDMVAKWREEHELEGQNEHH